MCHANFYKNWQIVTHKQGNQLGNNYYLICTYGQDFGSSNLFCYQTKVGVSINDSTQEFGLGGNVYYNFICSSVEKFVKVASTDIQGKLLAVIEKLEKMYLYLFTAISSSTSFSFMELYNSTENKDLPITMSTTSDSNLFFFGRKAPLLINFTDNTLKMYNSFHRDTSKFFYNFVNITQEVSAATPYGEFYSSKASGSCHFKDESCLRGTSLTNCESCYAWDFYYAAKKECKPCADNCQDCTSRDITDCRACINRYFL